MFQGPRTAPIFFKFYQVKYRLAFLFSSVVNVIKKKNTEFSYSFEPAVKRVVLGTNDLAYWISKIIISVSRRDIKKYQPNWRLLL